MKSLLLISPLSIKQPLTSSNLQLKTNGVPLSRISHPGTTPPHKINKGNRIIQLQWWALLKINGTGQLQFKSSGTSHKPKNNGSPHKNSGRLPSKITIDQCPRCLLHSQRTSGRLLRTFPNLLSSNGTRHKTFLSLRNSNGISQLKVNNLPSKISFLFQMSLWIILLNQTVEAQEKHLGVKLLELQALIRSKGYRHSIKSRRMLSNFSNKLMIKSVKKQKRSNASEKWRIVMNSDSRESWNKIVSEREWNKMLRIRSKETTKRRYSSKQSKDKISKKQPKREPELCLKRLRMIKHWKRQRQENCKCKGSHRKNRDPFR